MYTSLLDESEGVVVARVQAGASSAELTSGALRAIVALDGATYRLPFPRVTLAILDDDAEHFGPGDRERIVRANCAVRHKTLRLLVTRSGLHTATLVVMKQLVDEGSKAVWGTYGTVDQALAASAVARPGLDRVARRLLGVLDDSRQSGVVRTARPVSASPPAKAWMR